MDFWDLIDRLGMEQGSVDLMERAQVECARETRDWKRRQRMLEFWRATHPEAQKPGKSQE